MTRRAVPVALAALLLAAATSFAAEGARETPKAAPTPGAAATAAAAETPREGKTPLAVAPKIELYGTSWCGYCKKARKFFQSRGLPFTDYDIEKDQEAYARFRKMNPQGGVPAVVIGRYLVPGYSEEGFEKAIALEMAR